MQMKKSIIQPILFGSLCFILAVTVWAQAPSPDASAQETVKANGLANFLAGNLESLLKANNIFFPSRKAEAGAAAAGQPAEATEELFTLNYNNAGIEIVLKFLSDMTGKVVMRDDKVQGQITIIVPDKVTQEKAMDYIEEAFALKQLTILETDSILIVLPTSEAIKKGIEVDVGKEEGAVTPRMKTQIIPLEHASAAQLKEDLQPLMSENAKMIADLRTNSLVITESGTNIARLMAIIKELDRAEEGSGLVTRIFSLKYTDATQLSTALDQMMIHLNAKPGVQTPKGPVVPTASPTKILADPITNSLIVSGTEKDVVVVEQFVKALDISGSKGQETVTIKLREADASSLADQISRVLKKHKSGFQDAVVVADSWTNSLIVSGYPEDIEAVRRLAHELDETKTADMDTRVFMIEEADASVLSEILSNVLGSGDSGGGRYSYYSRYYGRGGGGDSDQPQITVDTRLNALVIKAKTEDFSMIDDLIEQLDISLPESKEEPRIFPLKYADARSLAELLNDLFSDRENSFGYFFFSSRSTSISGLSGKVKVIADPATNSLIVIASSPRGFEVVQKMLEDLDRISPEFGSTIVIELKHANAEELAESLTSLFEEDPRDRGGRGSYWFMGGGSGDSDRVINNLIGNVRVIADVRTNSVIVSTPQQNIEPVKKIIEQLDHPTSQVLVEILIVELSSDSDRNLGIQWGGEDGQVSGRASWRFQTPFLTQEQGSTGEPFRSTTLTSSEFDAVVNILAKDTASNVVARPNILTANNKEASVNVGKDIQYFTGIEATETGSLQSTDFRPVGLTLVVKPQVNESTLDEKTGLVTMDITVTTGDQALDVAGLPAGLQAFNKREVKTNVTVENGMTVVLSGVIDEAWTDAVQGVPVLKSIPLLGNVFKNKRKIQTKTELITFITPWILDTSQQIQEVTDRHMKNESYQHWLERQKAMESMKPTSDKSE
ncbi:MAG: secretin N-terminal domain-containing protein [bacterium]